jgi:hypothetical protein
MNSNRSSFKLFLEPFTGGAVVLLAGCVMVGTMGTLVFDRLTGKGCADPKRFPGDFGGEKRTIRRWMSQLPATLMDLLLELADAQSKIGRP